MFVSLLLPMGEGNAAFGRRVVSMIITVVLLGFAVAYGLIGWKGLR